jgi:hypothetical protein
MKRPVLFLLMGGLAVGAGLVTYRLRSQAQPQTGIVAKNTNAVVGAKSNSMKSAEPPSRAGDYKKPTDKSEVSEGDEIQSRRDLDALVQRVRSGNEAGALRFDNPDLMSVLQELEQRTADLNRRELELKQLSERVIAEQAALQSLTSRVAAMQQKLDESIRQRLNTIRQAERERREATGRKWSGLQPADVVTLAIGLPPEETLAILRTLPRETAARIVEALAKNGSSGARQLVDMMQQVSPGVDDRSSKP